LKKLSVIIVSYNVCYFLEQALLSVRKALAGLEAEVFVVDNNSADHSVAMVQRRFPEVKLLVNATNQGFAKANNQAINQATGQYILLLNPDTVVAEDAFTHCLEFMDRHPEAGGLGVKMLDGKGDFLPESMRGLPTPAVAFHKITGLTAVFPRSRVFGRYYLGYLDRDQVQEVDVLAGAFMFLRRESLQCTGLLDESFFMYGEDIDLSYRLQKAGFKNYYLPQARIIHYKGESTRRGSLNYVYLFYRAMSVFVTKHFSGRQAAFFAHIIHLAIIARAAMSASARFIFFLLPFLARGVTRPQSLKMRKIAVVGGSGEYLRAAALLGAAQVPAQLLGFFSADPADRANGQYLGNLTSLPEAKALYGLEELIFCGRDLSSVQIMDWMEQLNVLDLRYKILPEGRDYIIGSYSKNSRGDFYARP
jgi:GT2 family glycosyltransferase